MSQGDDLTNLLPGIVYDPVSKLAAVIDSVLDFDAAARTSTASADEIIAFVKYEGLTVEWLLETRAHADHLSAAPYIQERLGGRLAIGRDIIRVQNVFGKLFNPASVTGYPAVPDGYLIGSAHTCPSPVHRNWSRPVARRGANSYYDMYNK